MSSAKTNKQIARLIVGAMSIDGELDQKEREKVVQTLEKIGMDELIADVGAALDVDCGTLNIFEDAKELMESLGSSAKELSPMIFRIITDVIASDRFVSSREAAYLASLSKRLDITLERSQEILQQVIAERRSRLEVSGESVDEVLNPQLKQLLSFKGADEVVGEADANDIMEMMHKAEDAIKEGEKVCFNDVERALTILGLKTNAKLEDARSVWRETIENLNLPKMADQGETFVSAAINRIKRINDAYKVIAKFHEQHGMG